MDRSPKRHRAISPRSRRPLQQWARRLRYFYYRFVRMEGSVESIARGFAAGVFSGMFPLFGIQTLIGVAIAVLVRGNKLTAAAGTWVSNPITDIPIFFFNFKVGQWLLKAQHLSLDFTNLRSFNDFLMIGADLIAVWFTGCLIVGCFASIASYFLSLRFVRQIRQRRRSSPQSQKF